MKLLPAALFLLGPIMASASPAFTSHTPVDNFRLPTFTKDGRRSMLIQGSEAIVAAEHIDLVNLNLTLFKGDAHNTVETVILSPAATAEPATETVHGSGFVRMVSNDLEVTGTGWTYDHRLKKVSLAAHARVVFHAQLPDILK
ncbi:MAG: hypothetical protein ACHQ4G_11690 [Opitutales bacterium]